MKLEHALAMIRNEPISAFRVSYEHTDGRFITYDCFPSHATRPQEPPLTSLEFAWQLAERFAACAPDSYRNITVVGADFQPVDANRVLRPNVAGNRLARQGQSELTGVLGPNQPERDDDGKP